MEIRWARSATKHGISRNRSRHVVETASAIIRQPAPERSSLRDERIIFLGPDPTGELLEVMAVETTRGLLVIHAMEMRARYRPLLEGGQHGD